MDQIINGPFMAAEVYRFPTGRAWETVQAHKPSDDFLEKLATLRRLTGELEQQKLDVAVHVA